MKGSKSSSDAKGLGLTASIKGLAMAGAEENEVIPNGSSNPELALKVSLKFIKKIVSISFHNTSDYENCNKGPRFSMVSTVSI